MSWLNQEGDDPYEDYADRVRVRPNPKANRPRTKRRPEHATAARGMVFAVDRGRYSVILAGDKAVKTRILATRARELHKTPIVIGDEVDIVGDISGDEGTLARIVRIAERRTLLRRSADDSDRVERVMVANADQMLIVVAAKNPEPRVRLVDRYLVAAYDAGIKPLICITKTDLKDPSDFLEHFSGLNIPIFPVAAGQSDLRDLHQQLRGQKTVFVGHSGVGKSTLINALVPNAARETGNVNAVTGRGRHTSSSSIAFELEENSASATGWVIDTPGVRSFGLGHVDQENLLRGFKELASIIENCPRGCTHLESAPDCELDTAIASGSLDEPGISRVHSLRRLLSNLEE